MQSYLGAYLQECAPSASAPAPCSLEQLWRAVPPLQEGARLPFRAASSHSSKQLPWQKPLLKVTRQEFEVPLIPFLEGKGGPSKPCQVTPGSGFCNYKYTQNLLPGAALCSFLVAGVEQSGGSQYHQPPAQNTGQLHPLHPQVYHWTLHMYYIDVILTITHKFSYPILQMGD